MKRWIVEVIASNNVVREFNSLDKVREYLENRQGQLSLIIIDQHIGHEAFNGYVDVFCRQYDNGEIMKDS